MKTDKLIQLGGLEKIILIAVKQLTAASGAEVNREIERRLDTRLDIGVLYTVLDRLVAKNLLSSDLENKQSYKRGRKTVKRFSLTKEGEEAIEYSVGILVKMLR